MPTKGSKSTTMTKMYVKKRKIMSKFNNSLRIAFSVQNYILCQLRGGSVIIVDCVVCLCLCVSV